MAKKNPKRIAIITVIICAIAMMLTLILHHNPLADVHEENLKKIVACAIIVAAVLIFIRLYDRIVTLPVELWQNRKLIWKLAKNDFKTRFAGSYLGKVWAFLQPVVTITLYWFVFEYVMKAKAAIMSNGIDAPYVLWLTAGLVPWFYFTEALNNGMTALLEYNYLVKKVVFKISILPIIKIIGATFIHVFFLCFMLVLYFCYGYPLDPTIIQLVYYSACMFILVLAISYSTCAIIVFFRDLAQIVAIGLQIGMWATPIMWDISILPANLQFFFKLNPVFYIVNGYRDAMFDHSWFWEDFYSTMYFWIVVVVLFGVGALIFRRLKVHFADVM